MPLWPALARQHPSLRRSAKLPRDRTTNPVEQPAIRSFPPARTPTLRPKTTRSTGLDYLHQHSRRRQIPIAPAALSVPHTPRFRALALFGRRLSERGDRPVIPASENLHTKRLPDCSERSSFAGLGNDRRAVGGYQYSSLDRCLCDPMTKSNHRLLDHEKG